MSTEGSEFVLGVEFEGSSFTLGFHSEQDHIGRQVAQTGGFYEADLLQALRPLVLADDVVVDVGANVGNHSIFFAGVMGCRVFAFEPFERTCDLLRLNIRDNGLTDRIFARQYALGAATGTVEVESFDELNLGATRFKSGADGHVNIRPLDSVPDLADVHVSLIKIDVEGMELDVVSGSRGILTRDRPIVVCECAEPEDFVQTEALLRKSGYRVTECFNATPTYIFLPDEWTGRGRYSRLQYFEDATARTSSQLRSLMSQVGRTRSGIGNLSRRLDALELLVAKGSGDGDQRLDGAHQLTVQRPQT